MEIFGNDLSVWILVSWFLCLRLNYVCNHVDVLYILITRWRIKSGPFHFVTDIGYWKFKITVTCRSTVPKRWIKMFFNMFTLRCNNWSQSFPKMSPDGIIHRREANLQVQYVKSGTRIFFAHPIISLRNRPTQCLPMTSWMTSQRIFNMNSTIEVLIKFREQYRYCKEY